VVALIQKLWETAWDLWEHRNGLAHEQENLVTRSMGIHLNNRIARLFNDLCSRPIKSQDRHLVHLPLTILLGQSVNYKVQWLSVAEPASREGRRQCWNWQQSAECMTRGFWQCMFSWLKR